MSTVSSFQVTQKERAGVSIAEKELTCMERSKCRSMETNRRKLKAGHIQGKYDQDKRLCKHGNGRIWPFFLQRAASKRDRILIFWLKKWTREPQTDRKTRNRKRNEDFLLFKWRTRLHMEMFSPCRQKKKPRQKKTSLCIHEEATRQIRLIPKLCSAPRYLRKNARAINNSTKVLGGGRSGHMA